MMAWAWEEITGDWLGDGRLAYLRDVIVNAFETVEARFGRQWLEDSRRDSGARQPTRGTSPTRGVVVLGMQLAAIESAENTGPLLKKLRDHRPDARAELDAACPCGSPLNLSVTLTAASVSDFPEREEGHQRPPPAGRAGARQASPAAWGPLSAPRFVHAATPKKPVQKK
jgi:hypothetical protein